MPTKNQLARLQRLEQRAKAQLQPRGVTLQQFDVLWEAYCYYKKEPHERSAVPPPLLSQVQYRHRVTIFDRAWARHQKELAERRKDNHR